MLTSSERVLVGLPPELDEEQRRVVSMAIGRLFRLLCRPYQEGDEAEYERVRAIVLELVLESRSYEPDVRSIRI